MSYALYYPSIEFADLKSLKRSLLIWERVFRIVPSNYRPIDCPQVQEAISTGAIQNIIIDENEKFDAAQKFLDFYATRESCRNLLVWPAGFSTKSFARLNTEKIDAKLLPLFEQLATRFTEDGFLDVPRDLAGSYMFYLANSVAKKRTLDLLTDSYDYWAVGTYFSHKGAFTEEVYVEKANTYLANLAINDLLPGDIENISIDTILKFRENTFEQRKLLNEELRSLRNQISRCNNKTHAHYIVQDFIKQFERAKKEYRDSIKFFGKSDICSIFSVGLPVSATMIAMPTFNNGDPYEPWRIGTGMLIGAVSALAARAMGNKNETVPSYLVNAEELVKKPNIILQRKFNEFIND